MGNMLKLKEAVEEGDVENVKNYLKSLNLRKERRRHLENSQNFLHVACKHQNPTKEMVQVLLENGEEVNVREEREGKTPLHFAVLNPKMSSEIVDLLLKNGSQVDLLDISLKSALHYACELEYVDINIVSSLISSTKDINLRENGSERSCLMILLDKEKPNLELIKLILVNKCADTNLVSSKKEHMSFWEQVLKRSHKFGDRIDEILFLTVSHDEKLVKGVNIIHSCRNFGWKNFNQFLERLDKRTCQKLLNEITFEYLSSTSKKDRRVVERLVSNLNPPNVRDCKERNVVTLLCEVDEEFTLEMVTSLAERGVNTDKAVAYLLSQKEIRKEMLPVLFRKATPPLQITLLKKALKEAPLDLIEILASNSDLNAKDGSGKTVLFDFYSKASRKLTKREKNVLDLLCQKGSNLNIPCSDGARSFLWFSSNFPFLKNI